MMFYLCFILIGVIVWVAGSVAVPTAQRQQVLEYMTNNPIDNSTSYFDATSGCIEKFYATRTTQGNPPRYCRMNTPGMRDNSVRTLGTRPKCEYKIVSSNIVSSLQRFEFIIS